MANEITIGSSITAAKGNFKLPRHGGTFRADMSGSSGGIPGLKVVTTSEVSEVFTGITTLGWFWMQNLDATNYVQWGFATTVYGGRMNPGEPAGPFRLEPGTTLYLKANTATCRVAILVMEN